MYINLLLLLFCYLTKAVCQQLTLALCCCWWEQVPTPQPGSAQRGQGTVPASPEIKWNLGGEQGLPTMRETCRGIGGGSSFTSCPFCSFYNSWSFPIPLSLCAASSSLSAHFPSLALHAESQKSLILEKIKSNLQLNTTMPSKLYHICSFFEHFQEW